MKTEIYLDNAATSWPKPAPVLAAVDHYLRACGGTPARGRHPKAGEAGQIQKDCRARLQSLLGATVGYRLAFTSGATEATNLAIKGLVPRGAHVVVTELEHNSVLRPLRALETEWTIVRAKPDGSVDPARVRDAIRPDTAMVACTHASNVVGTVVDVGGIAQVARERKVPFLVDAAQTVGVIPIDVAAMGIDLFAFTGHKSLLGPPAIGGLIFREDLDFPPLKEGGTGTFSESFEQPRQFPDRYESGSPNMVGIAGLGAGVAWVESHLASRRKHEMIGYLHQEFARLGVVRVYGAAPDRNVGILSINVEGRTPDAVADALWERSGIMVRSGLHCAPFIHERLGTAGRGTVRIGVGWETTFTELEVLVETIAALA